MEIKVNGANTIGAQPSGLSQVVAGVSILDNVIFEADFTIILNQNRFSQFYLLRAGMNVVKIMVVQFFCPMVFLSVLWMLPSFVSFLYYGAKMDFCNSGYSESTPNLHDTDYIESCYYTCQCKWPDISWCWLFCSVRVKLFLCELFISDLTTDYSNHQWINLPRPLQGYHIG